ncbi:MAG TPA: hypothetical protein VGA16_04195 [Candidatus Limnocylindria bacterium]
MDERQDRALDAWLAGLPAESLQRYFLLLDELCRGLDVSKHEQFGFLRLRAEFETSGEIFGCTLEQLRDRVARRLPERLRGNAEQPRTALERLRERVQAKGHPDFR